MPNDHSNSGKNQHPVVGQNSRESAKSASEKSNFCIVGIGASAGGLEAFKIFFDHMPADSGMAFVLVTHLSPAHKSHVAELLMRHTDMPVTEVEDGIAVEPNHVYVIPPDATLKIRNRVLSVAQSARPTGGRTTIDDFFMSLAEDQGRNAICIVLSGTGSDGTLGLKAIKEYGGVTITQAEGSAEYDDMPRSARATGQGDYVLAVQEMPARLLEYDGHIQTAGDGEVGEKLREDGQDWLARILNLLHQHVGHDFSQYKESTVVRRIGRRMQVTQTASPEAYLERLRASPAEIDLLFNDMLINVTAFMRDRQVFDRLSRDFVPAICQSKDEEDAGIRVWVPGCATGEEVYSLAIMFLEELARIKRNIRLQMFGSDVDAQALEVARAGIYSHAVAKQLSPARLKRFFREHDHGCMVAKALREPCIFSRHDVINTPPFSRLDLISCRNVLIYMSSALQQRLIPVFHYALRPNGLLVLGPSETVTGFEELFEPVDSKLRIYRRREAAVAPSYVFPGSVASQFTLHQPVKLHRRESDVRRQVERYLLDQYTPSCVIVNTRFDAVHYFGATGQFLEQPAGAPDSNILSLARQGLRKHLRAALEQAARKRETVERDNIHVKANGDYTTVRLRVRPVLCGTEAVDYYAVIFELAERQTMTAANMQMSARPTEQEEQTLVLQLEEELQSSRRRLQTTIEDLEASNEELKSSNEELMSTNEEMQSTAEELDTSKEELQSVNEELVVANDELRRHAGDLVRANCDIKNLLDNTQIAMMFLDERFKIKALTPRMSDLYHVRESDVDRSILDIRAKHDYTELESDTRHVLDTTAPFERHVRSNEHEYILRMLPYRTLDGHIDGVVVTFIDITNLVQAREEIGRMLQSRTQRAGELELMLSTLPVGVAICTDAEGRHVRTNKAGAEILGVQEQADIAGHEQPELFTLLGDNKVLAQADFPIQRVLTTAEPVRDLALRVKRRDGTNRDIEFSAWPVLNESGEATGAVGVLLDMTERKRELEFQALQHTVIAQLGVFALYERDVMLVMRRVLDDICTALDVDHAEIWRRDGDPDHRLLLEMSTACGSGQVRELALGNDRESPLGRTLIYGEAVTLQNGSEALHAQLPHLSDQGIICTLSVPITHGEEIYGVLSVHHSQRRHFLPYETNFLQSIADLLGGVLRRKQLEIGHGQDQRRQGFADAEERMRQAERLASLGTLAAGIAHEVNNPLNSILMNAELGLISLNSANAQEKLTKLLTTIVKEAQRGGSITRNVLHFSKADRYTPKGQADLNKLVGRVREHVASVLQKHNARLDLELEQSLPELELNQIAMEQAMVNLISNAAQSGASRIVVNITRRVRSVRIVVSDNGRGIPQQELEHIFDPFYTTRRSQGGSGLGLSLVHRIVADHNGTVEAHSGAGEGTRFIVRLPLPRNESETLHKSR